MSTLFQFEDAGVFSSLMTKPIAYEELNAKNRETKEIFAVYSEMFQEENISKNAKGKIRFLMSKLGYHIQGYINEDNYKNIIELIKLCYRKQTYNFFNEVELTKFLFIPETRNNIQLLLDSNFILSNKNLLEKQNGTRILKLIIESKKNICYLEYLRLFNSKEKKIKTW